MRFHLFLGAVVAVTLAVALPAQQAPSGYYGFACIKVKPGKGAEFQEWAADSLHKFQQANVDSGRFSAWFLLNSVMPQGISATCDYYSLWRYPALPSPPMGAEAVGEALKKASAGVGAREFIERRTALVELVSMEIWQIQIGVGTVQKGDYLFINRMKVPKVDEWVDMEKKIWQPMAEQWVKDGGLHGWFLNLPVLPGGSELKYQATTVDVLPNWEAAMKYGADISETFKKAHPGKDMEHTFEYLKMRDLAVQELWKVEDVVRPAK